jgi:hypothetical protein
MTKRKTTKEQITEVVVGELPLSTKLDIGDNIDRLLTRWWTTGRQEGLRLTEMGDVYFRLAEIEFYNYELTSDIEKNADDFTYRNFLLSLNKKIKCPYFLGVNKVEGKNVPYIRFYDSKIAMMVQLYGSLKEYLNSIKERK